MTPVDTKDTYGPRPVRGYTAAQQESGPQPWRPARASKRPETLSMPDKRAEGTGLILLTN